MIVHLTDGTELVTADNPNPDTLAHDWHAARFIALRLRHGGWRIINRQHIVWAEPS